MDALGFKAGQVAYMTGMSAAQIYRLLNGQRPQARASTIAMIAEALRTTSDYLMGRSDNPALPTEFITEPQSELEWELLDKFLALSEEDKRYEIAHLDLLLKHRYPTAPRIIGDEDEETDSEDGSH